MKSGPVKVLRIDLDKKNLLVVNSSGIDSDNPDEWFKNFATRIQEWMRDDSMSLFVVGTNDGLEIRLEKIEPERETKMVGPKPPGIELDKLIAENIWGWKFVGDPATVNRNDWENMYGQRSENQHLPYFSVSIKEAAVLAVLQEICVTPIGNQWSAFRWNRNIEDAAKNIAPTAAHAICLATLMYHEESERKIKEDESYKNKGL